MPEVPSQEEWDEMDDAERETREREFERATLARRKPDLEAELKEIAELIDHAQRVEEGGHEIKLSRLKAQLTEQGVFADPSLRLLIFTEYKDTLDYLVAKLRSWNLTVGQIHGSMKPGSRDEEGTRLWAERNVPAHTHLKTDRETEKKAVEGVIAYEQARGCKIEDVQEQNLGFDLRSLHPLTGELRLIEVKGIGAATGTIFLSPNEKRIAEDRHDLYWLYIVTHCDTVPTIQDPIKDPARFPWHEVKKVEHYKLEVNALAEPMQLKEDPPRYRTTNEDE